LFSGKVSAVPHYLRYRFREKECANEVEDENGGTKRCGEKFITSNPAQKYCAACKLTKPWAIPAIKRL
jgi:hypothetical protein